MDLLIKLSDHKRLFFVVFMFIWIITLSLISYQCIFFRPAWTIFSELILVSIILSVLAYYASRRLVMNIIKKLKLEKMRLEKRLSNDINHELKTPVASMQVCLETLLSGIDLDEDKRQELITRCYKHNERLRKLLAALSLITRMEDGSQLISKEPVLLNDVIQDVDDELEIIQRNKKFTLNVDFDKEVEINANMSIICSIFSNLTQNSILYSEGENIYITLLEDNKKFCKIRFEDDGVGVGEEQLSHLFDRFYRLDSGRSRKLGGTGLGLAIVKHAVQFHGGTITASNRPEGGLRFEFTLSKR